MKTTIDLPYYAKLVLILIGLFVFFNILFIVQGILVPLIYATIVAVLLSPLVHFFSKKGVNHTVSIIIVIFLLFSVLTVIVLLLSNQVLRFSESLPNLMEKIQTLSDQVVSWISKTFDISIRKINFWMKEQNEEIIDKAGSGMGQTLTATGSALVVVFILPIYIFLLLFYQAMLLKFLRDVFKFESRTDLNDVITTTKKIIQTYFVGLLIETVIITILYTITLFALGIDYALLLAVTGGVINLIPYLGAIIAAVLPMIIALATKTPTDALLVLGVYIFIQFVDNNYIIPRVVASRVRINALVSIIAVIAGGYLWGIAGMFLAIPLVAIVKVIFDHVEGLKPWGYVLGDIIPAEKKYFFRKSKDGI